MKIKIFKDFIGDGFITITILYDDIKNKNNDYKLL